MTLLSVILDIIKKRPLMCSGIVLCILPFCIFEYLIVFPIVFGAWSIGTGNIFEVTIYLIQIALSGLGRFKSHFPQSFIMLVLIFTGVVSFAVLSSGCFYVANGDVNNRHLDFIDGVKMYFKKINKVILTFFSISSIFFFFSIIVALPSLVLTRASAENSASGVLFKVSLVIVDLSTIVILFYEVVLLLVYFSFWIAAIFCFDKGSFSMARKIVFNNYWELIVKFLIFVGTFFGFEIGFAVINIFFSKHINNLVLGVIIFVIVNCFIKSLFFISFITYIFKEFKDKKEILYKQILE